jgi:uncharacterized iron-regulated membrane protein
LPIGLRTTVFWCHLMVGLTAGAVVLTMSVTGALLALEPQLVAWAERDLWRAAPPTPEAPRLPLTVVVTRAGEHQGGQHPVTVTTRPEPESSVRVGFGRDAVVFMNPYTGDAVGRGSTMHAVMHAIEDWHRWLGARDLGGRAITGAANLAFLGLAISGLYLWRPRAWSHSAVRAVTVVDIGLRGRARLLNWHTVIGFWCAPVLIVLTLTGAIMSYQWANTLLYRLTGNEPPPPPVAQGGARAAGPGTRGPSGAPAPDGERRRGGGATLLDLDALHTRAASRTPHWATLTLRLPQRPGGPVTAVIQEPPTWHPRPRSVLTLDAATAAVVHWESFREANMGRTLRGLARVAHSGEVGGVPGQLIAGLASAGGALLVCTGASLAWRRYRAWAARGPQPADADRSDAGIISTS